MKAFGLIGRLGDLKTSKKFRTKLLEAKFLFSQGCAKFFPPRDVENMKDV